MSLPKPNLIERTLSNIGLGGFAARNYQARLAFYGAGQYAGARSEKTSMRNFNPAAGSADSDSLGDLPALRARSRDLTRNAGLARGARNTSKVNVVGRGLRMRSMLQRELLGLSDAQAEAWEDRAEVLFDLWARSKFCDVTRTQNFYELQALAFLGAFDSGDVFAMRRYKEGGSFLALCVQMIEADRVATPDDAAGSTRDIRDGVEVDRDGQPLAVHIRNTHPGDDLVRTTTYRPTDRDFVRVPVMGENGTPLVIHLFDKDRIGLTRGVPALAPVIESLKQLDRYTEAELMAAVVSAFFTVFIKNTEGGSDIVGEGETIGGPPLPANQVALGSGTIIEGAPGEEPTVISSNRPNPNFDPFWLAMVRQIGISLGIPYEVLIMHFSSSYTASKAALEVARQFYLERRTWLARNFCQPVYEWFLAECVARGIIEAPGFFEDPIRRAAWCGCDWIGPAQITLDPAKEAKAAEAYVDLGIKTLEEVTHEVTGGDIYRNLEVRGREVAQRKALKLDISPAKPAVPPPTPAPTQGGAPNAGS
jgi:lambda family phage portal protein